MAEIKKEKAKSAERHEKRKGKDKDHGKSAKGGGAKSSNRRPSKKARDKAKSTK